MPRVTKVYVASSKRDKFNFLGSKGLGDEVASTDDPAGADLIIVDLADPVPLAWVGQRASSIAGPGWAPCLLTAFEGARDQKACDTIREVFAGGEIGKVYEDCDRPAFEQQLRWLHSNFRSRQDIAQEQGMFGLLAKQLAKALLEGGTPHA